MLRMEIVQPRAASFLGALQTSIGYRIGIFNGTMQARSRLAVHHNQQCLVSATGLTETVMAKITANEKFHDAIKLAVQHGLNSIELAVTRGVSGTMMDINRPDGRQFIELIIPHSLQNDPANICGLFTHLLEVDSPFRSELAGIHRPLGLNKPETLKNIHFFLRGIEPQKIQAVGDEPLLQLWNHLEPVSKKLGLKELTFVAGTTSCFGIDLDDIRRPAGFIYLPGRNLSGRNFLERLTEALRDRNTFTF